MKLKLTTVAATLTALFLSSTASYAQTAGTVAFLMPDQGSTRYDEHDWPFIKMAITTSRYSSSSSTR